MCESNTAGGVAALVHGRTHIGDKGWMDAVLGRKREESDGWMNGWSRSARMKGRSTQSSRGGSDGMLLTSWACPVLQPSITDGRCVVR